MRKSWWHYTHPNMTPTTHPLRSLVILLKNHSFMNCQDLDIINTFWARCNGSSGPLQHGHMHLQWSHLVNYISFHDSRRYHNWLTFALQRRYPLSICSRAVLNLLLMLSYLQRFKHATNIPQLPCRVPWSSHVCVSIPGHPNPTSSNSNFDLNFLASLKTAVLNVHESTDTVKG